MELVALLSARRDALIAQAEELVERSHLQGYERLGREGVRARLEALLDRLIASLQTRSGNAMADYGERLGEERFHSGFELAEVLGVINGMEETLWRTIVEELEPGQYAQALGLVSSALGTAKSALACTYVSQASKTHVTSVDLGSLQAGTEAGPNE